MSQSSVQLPSVVAGRIYHPSLGVPMPLIKGWGDHSAWERPKVIAQTKTAVYGQLHAIRPATKKRDETQPAFKLSFQRVKSLPLVFFFKPHLPTRTWV